AGQAIVVPALAARGIRRLDALVLSHADMDHAGGLDAVLATLRPRRRYASQPARAGVGFEPCHAAAPWRWDGVEFRWLLAPAGSGRSENDRSCVLKVGSGYGRLLLSGDIERGAERGLLAGGGGRLASEVLIVPHHGSRSSSTPAFIDAVRPVVAIAATGYGNRYGLPHAEVVSRYRRRGVRWLDTARDGAVIVDIGPNGVALSPQRPARVGFWSATR
ncbi:MAG: ComEC/Rec2 family competence protein, partial [Gammaproteobacteria bacterium]